MSDIAIEVAGLSKRYRLGEGGGERMLRESIQQGARRALRAVLGREKSDGRGAEDFWAIKDVSFNVNRGEVVGIIGGNGAGKSTLLKILSRITDPTEGRARIHGRVGSLLEVGTGFHPELSGRENIYLNGTILGMKRAEIKAKFDQIIAFAEVEKFLDTPVKRYSSGMYVRLAFSVAAHLEPEILIVDEVLAVGDAAFQAKCLGKMQSAAGSGRTILFVSHNMAAIDGLCHRCIVLKGGRIIFAGEKDEAIRHYLDMADHQGQDGEFELSARQKQDHDTAACVLSARVTSDGHFRRGGYRVGEPLEFTVRCQAKGLVKQPGLGIGLDNVVGQRVVTFHTQTSGVQPHPVSPGEFAFTCRIDDLALVPGLYNIKLSLEDGRKKLHELDHALRFEIVAADYYGDAGRHYRGVIFCKQKWQMPA